MSKKSKILDQLEIDQKIKRLAWQLYENNMFEEEIFCIGISDRGLFLAKQIEACLTEISEIKTRLARLDIDKRNPYNTEVILKLEPTEYINKVVVLVDDVLNSGRTLMYSAKHFLTSPLKKLSILVLIDRNHNRYPIKADYVGLSLATTLHEYINVELDGPKKGVYLS